MEIKQALHEHRLVTLTGSGGTGKTRLSLQVAADLLDLFPDGVWFIELAPLTNPDLIPRTILSAFGVGEQEGNVATQLLLDPRVQKKLLIVLDNCEHLIEACAQLVNSLLSHSPALKILASSREAWMLKARWHGMSLRWLYPMSKFYGYRVALTMRIDSFIHGACNSSDLIFI